MPSGVSRLDVSAIIKTDDGALLYITYNGIIKNRKKKARVTPTKARDSQPFPHPVREGLLPEWVQLILENQRITTLLPNVVYIVFRRHPHDEEWAQPKVFAHSNFHFKLISIYIRQRVFYLRAIRNSVSLKHAI